MTRIIDTANLSIFYAITGGLVLAYSVTIIITRSSFQTINRV
jgi:hypothetical protein